MDNDNKTTIEDPYPSDWDYNPDFGKYDEGEEDFDDVYDPYNDPDWEPPCPCWCELCGCHGDCYDWDDEKYDDEELDD